MATELSVERIVETFEMLPDWEHRYHFLDELGGKLPVMASVDQTDETKVHQCMSDVWVKAVRSEKNAEKIEFNGDCNTATIKGVVAVLTVLFSNKTPAQIEQTDIDELFKKLQLFDHLSPNRHVGVYAIVEKMKQQAREITF